MLVHIEALKAQRDLYLAFRDLFARHDSTSFSFILFIFYYGPLSVVQAQSWTGCIAKNTRSCS